MSRKFKLTIQQREKIAHRFKEIILDHDYEDYTEFADHYEINRRTLQHWITEGKINIEFLRIFCEDFNIDLRWLLFGPPYPKNQKPHPK